VGIQMVSLYEASVDKDTNSSRVDQGLYREKLGDISSLKINKKIEGSLTYIKSTNSRV